MENKLAKFCNQWKKLTLKKSKAKVYENFHDFQSALSADKQVRRIKYSIFNTQIFNFQFWPFRYCISVMPPV